MWPNRGLPPDSGAPAHSKARLGSGVLPVRGVVSTSHPVTIAASIVPVRSAWATMAVTVPPCCGVGARTAGHGLRPQETEQ